MASPSDRTSSSRESRSPGVRTAQRPKQRATQARMELAAVPNSVEDSGRLAEAVATAGRRGARITWRLFAFLLVIVILVVTYANSLRVYFNQQSQIADAKAQVQANQQTVDDLYDQLERWQDPAYVKAQARDRLGWVMPGEIGFQVIGPDGKPLGAGANIGTPQPTPDADAAKTWWDRLTGSIQTADDPAPAPPR